MGSILNEIVVLVAPKWWFLLVAVISTMPLLYPSMKREMISISLHPSLLHYVWMYHKALRNLLCANLDHHSLVNPENCTEFCISCVIAGFILKLLAWNAGVTMLDTCPVTVGCFIPLDPCNFFLVHCSCWSLFLLDLWIKRNKIYSPCSCFIQYL